VALKFPGALGNWQQFAELEFGDGGGDRCVNDKVQICLFVLSVCLSMSTILVETQ
jgi:hypothetical protein